MKKLLSLFLIFVLSVALVFIIGSCSCNGDKDTDDGELKWDTSREVLKMEVIDGNLYVTYKDDQDSPVNLGKLIDGEVEWTTTLSFHPLSDGTYGIKCGNASNLTDIVIPSTFNTKSVTTILEDAFSGNTTLKTIVIPNSIKTVKENAFNNCTVETVTAPSCAITSLPKNTVKKVTVNSTNLNDERMFASFSVLTDVVISKEVESISGKAFNGCYSIKTFTVDADNPHYKSINGNIFSSDGYAIVRYASGKTESTFDIPTEAMYISMDAFNSSVNLTEINIPNSINFLEDKAFGGCIKLTSVTIGADVKLNGENIFVSCPIKEATVPTSALSFIPKESVEKIVLNGGTSLDAGALYDFTKLASLELSKDIASISENAFIDCPSLLNITVNEGNTNYKSINGNLYSYDEKTFVKYAVAKTDNSFSIPDGVVTIANSAFYDAVNLVSISIPNTVTTIESEAFSCCDSLISITVPNSVTSMGEAVFAICEKLENVILSSEITAIENGTFVGCEKLTSIIIPSNVTVIGAGSFMGCVSLASIVIPSSVDAVGVNAFSGCTNITINCEVSEKPENWHENWNDGDCTVNWGYDSE